MPAVRADDGDQGRCRVGWYMEVREREKERRWFDFLVRIKSCGMFVKWGGIKVVNIIV